MSTSPAAVKETFFAPEAPRTGQIYDFMEAYAERTEAARRPQSKQWPAGRVPTCRAVTLDILNTLDRLYGLETADELGIACEGRNRSQRTNRISEKIKETLRHSLI